MSQSKQKKDSIVRTARTFEGMKVHDIGASSMPCIRFIEAVCAIEKIPLPENMRALHREAFGGNDPTDRIMETLSPVSLMDVEDGDLLLFRYGRFQHHFGIRTTLFGRPGFIHAFERVGKVVEVSIDRAWRARLKRAFTFTGE